MGEQPGQHLPVLDGQWPEYLALVPVDEPVQAEATATQPAYFFREGEPPTKSPVFACPAPLS